MKFSEETWSNDDHKVDLVRAEEDGTVYVDHGRRDVKEGDYLIPSGSDTVGYYSVDVDQLKADGFTSDVDDQPVADATTTGVDTPTSTPVTADDSPHRVDE
jgi:hypothetical protein